MSERPRIEELKRRVQMDPASIAFAALAEEYRRLGRHDEAIEVCRIGLQRHPSYVSAHVTLGRALVETGRLDEARRELEYVLSVAPENLAAIRGLAEIHDRQRQSSDHPDLIASEMADVLAQPVSAPTAPGSVALKPPPQVAEEPSPRPVSRTSVPSPRAVPDAPPPEAAVAAPELSAPEVFVTKEPEPSELVERESPTADAFADGPVVVDALPQAPAHLVELVERPHEDPALPGLEAFLRVIVRAREAAGGVHAL